MNQTRIYLHVLFQSVCRIGGFVSQAKQSTQLWNSGTECSMAHILIFQIKQLARLGTYANQDETIDSPYNITKISTLKQRQATKPAGPEVAMSRSSTCRSPIFSCFPDALSCTGNQNMEQTQIRPWKEPTLQAVKGEWGTGARLKQGLDGVEGVHGDGGGAYRRRAGGRVAGEHVVAQRFAASNHRGDGRRAANKRWLWLLGFIKLSLVLFYEYTSQILSLRSHLKYWVIFDFKIHVVGHQEWLVINVGVVFQ
jgi:hypothetical protein